MQIFDEHWGIICNFTPILPYFQLWGGWTSTTIFFRWANQVKTKKKVFIKNGTLFSRIQVKTKKKIFTKDETLFFPKFKWRPALRCTPESNFWRGCADEDHTQIIGGNTVKLLGGIYPPIPPGFGTPDYSDNVPIHVGGSGSCVPSTQIAMSEPSIS